MIYTLVMMCSSVATGTPVWCPPIQTFDSKAECIEVRNQLMQSQPKESSFWKPRKEYACVPAKKSK